MKRSGFRKLTYQEALSKALKRRADKISDIASKTAQRQSKPRKSRISEAARAGKVRSKRKRAKKDVQDAKFKREVRVRDDFTCQWPDCGYRDDHIDVQHIAKRSQRPDLIYDPENGVCLCRLHHDLADNTVQGRRAAKKYGLAGGETYELAKKENKS